MFVHNKLMMSIETILDLNHDMQSGSSFVEAIKKKISLLGQLEGIPHEALETDLNSIALKLEKIVIAVMSVLVKGSDLDAVLCYICGNVPKIVCTDGNTKVRSTDYQNTLGSKYHFRTFSFKFHLNLIIDTISNMCFYSQTSMDL